VRLDPRRNASVAFSVGDVESGRLFRWLADYEEGRSIVTAEDSGGGSGGGLNIGSGSDQCSSSSGGSVGSPLGPLARRKAEALATEFWDDPIVGGGGGGGGSSGGGWGPLLGRLGLGRFGPWGGRGGPSSVHGVGLVRPPVRHVVMAYGVDLPTDLAYRCSHLVTRKHRDFISY